MKKPYALSKPCRNGIRASKGENPCVFSLTCPSSSPSLVNELYYSESPGVLWNTGTFHFYISDKVQAKKKRAGKPALFLVNKYKGNLGGK
jgi:hypothetical protein